METKTYNEKIRELNTKMLRDITDYVAYQGFFNFIYDEDAPKVNTVLHFYDGGKYPVAVTVVSMQVNSAGVLEFHREDGRTFTADKMLSSDIRTLNKGVEMYKDCTTPAQFAALVNRLSNFCIALNGIMDKNGWYDLTAAMEQPICWCPAEGILVTEDETGKAVCVKLDEYHSREIDWADAEQWFRRIGFEQMEKISGLKRSDYKNNKAYTDAVQCWWARIENDFPNNGKDEKIRIWKENI